MRALLVAGARPNFIKVAPILRALAEEGHEGILVHTRQHHDYEMSGAFFEDLEIPEPDHHLGVGSGTHPVQTVRCMEAFEPVLRDELGCRLTHVEAGLRSRDWSMSCSASRDYLNAG